MSFLKIGSRSRYALRFMVELAAVERALRMHQTQGRRFVSLRSVASSQDISWRYLEQIAPLLVAAGFVETVRGPTGGYRLLRDPTTLSVAEILRVIEPADAPMKCLDNDDDCERRPICPAAGFWKGLDDVVNNYLESVTLQDLMDDESAQTLGFDLMPSAHPTKERSEQAPAVSLLMKKQKA